MFKKLKKILFLYKFPFISIILTSILLSTFIYKNLQESNVNRKIKLQKIYLKKLKQNIKKKTKENENIKKQILTKKENIEKYIKAYKINEAINYLISPNYILVLNYKYKILKRKMPYRIVKTKMSFLCNYKNLKKYLIYLKDMGFNILEINLKNNKYTFNNKYTIKASLKLSFYLSGDLK